MVSVATCVCSVVLSYVWCLGLLISRMIGLQSWLIGVVFVASQVHATGLGTPMALQVVLGNWVDKGMPQSHYTLTLDQGGQRCSVMGSAGSR